MRSMILVMCLGLTAFGQEASGHFPLSGPAGPAAANDARLSPAVRTFHREQFALPLENARARYPQGVPYFSEPTEAGALHVRALDLRFPSLSEGLPADDPNATVHARYYWPESDQPVPVLLMLHHLQDEQTFELFLADFLAARGTAVMMMYLPHYGPRRAPGFDLPDAFEILEPMAAQAALDIHACRDWLHNRPEIDGEHVGMLGISLGAIVGTVAAGMDPGFDSHALVLAGGNLARVVFNGSRETRGIAASLQQRGLDEAAVRGLIAPAEPLSWAHRITGPVCMFNVSEDEIIPRDCTEALEGAIGGYTRIFWYTGEHAMLAIRAGEVLAEIERFARR